MTLSVPQGANTIHDTFEDGRYHLVLGLSPEANGVVEELALRFRGNKADVINLALGLLKHLSDSARDGKRIMIASPDGNLEREITGLGAA